MLAEADVTGRRRAHRRARPRRREAQGFFDDLKPGDYVVHHQHGVARYGGMVKRAIGGVERDYLLLEYRGDDRLYVPSDQIDAVRHYTGGDSPTLSRMGGGDWQKAKARVRSAVAEIAQELVVLYQKRRAHARPRVRARHAVAARARGRLPLRARRPTSCKAIADVKADMEAAVADGPPRVRRRRLRQDRGRDPGRVQGGPGRQAGGGARPHDAARPAALPDVQRPLRRLPGAGRGAVPLPHPGPGPEGGRRAGRAARSTSSSAPTACCPSDVAFKDLGLLVVDEEQRFGVSHKEAIKQLRTDVDVLTLTATPIPRTLEMSLTGIRDLTLLNTPPAERQPILTYVGEYDDRAVGEAIRRELLREGQVFFVHNRVQDIEKVAAEVARAGARGPRRRRARPDGRGHARAGRASTSGRASTTCWCARRSSSRASTCRR